MKITEKSPNSNQLISKPRSKKCLVSKMHRLALFKNLHNSQESAEKKKLNQAGDEPLLSVSLGGLWCGVGGEEVVVVQAGHGSCCHAASVSHSGA